jgi:integrase/recombinase XerD
MPNVEFGPTCGPKTNGSPIPQNTAWSACTLHQHLTLKGSRPKTIDAYSGKLRERQNTVGAPFAALASIPIMRSIHHLYQLTSYFNQLLQSHSWSTVKLDLYGLKFHQQHCKSPRLGRIRLGLLKPLKSNACPAATDSRTHPRAQPSRIFSLRSIAWDCAWARDCAYK